MPLRRLRVEWPRTGTLYPVCRSGRHLTGCQSTSENYVGAAIKDNPSSRAQRGPVQSQVEAPSACTKQARYRSGAALPAVQ
jgi:hypothetical protein